MIAACSCDQSLQSYQSGRFCCAERVSDIRPHLKTAQIIDFFSLTTLPSILFAAQAATLEVFYAFCFNLTGFAFTNSDNPRITRIFDHVFSVKLSSRRGFFVCTVLPLRPTGSTPSCSLELRQRGRRRERARW